MKIDLAGGQQHVLGLPVSHVGTPVYVCCERGQNRAMEVRLTYAQTSRPRGFGHLCKGC